MLLTKLELIGASIISSSNIFSMLLLIILSLIIGFVYSMSFDMLFELHGSFPDDRVSSIDFHFNDEIFSLLFVVTRENNNKLLHIKYIFRSLGFWFLKLEVQ